MATLHGPTRADVIFLAEQEAKRATIFRDKNGTELIAFFFHLIHAKKISGISVYRSACINLLIAELERFIEDPTTPKMHIFQECAWQAHLDLTYLRNSLVDRDNESAMALIESRIKDISATVCRARELYSAYEQRQMRDLEMQFGSGVSITGLPYSLEPESDAFLKPYDTPASFSTVPHLRCRSPSNPKKESSAWSQPVFPTRIPKPGVPTLEIQSFDDTTPETPDTLGTESRPDTPTTYAHYRQSSAVNLSNANSNDIRRTLSSINTPGLGLGLGLNTHARNNSSLSIKSGLSISIQKTRPSLSPTVSQLAPVGFEKNNSLPPSRVGTPDASSSGSLTESWGLKTPRRAVSAGGFHARTGSFLGAGVGERTIRTPTRLGTPFSKFFPSSKSGDGGEEVFGEVTVKRDD